jgi:hypothetical protein
MQDADVVGIRRKYRRWIPDTLKAGAAATKPAAESIQCSTKRR